MIEVGALNHVPVICPHGKVEACCSICGPSEEESVLDQVLSADGKRLTVCNVHSFYPGQVIDVHGSTSEFPLFGHVTVSRTGTEQGNGRLDNYDANVIEVSGAMRIAPGDVLVVHNPQHPSYLKNFPERS